ncbi:racemase/epimerase [Aureococcus anophagefferens]|nr:racemase/epimerase [Aureococcus anophagefferens]
MKAVLLALALSTDALIAPQRSFGGARRAAKSSAVTMSASKKILVTIVDNLSRRNIDTELGCDSLTPITHPEVRLEAWKELTGKTIHFENLDVATERAAPYSQKGAKQKRYTVDNNVCGTHNLLAAVVEADCNTHVVHLGTMGVYGYGTSGGEIPEGYIDVILPGGRESKILHPAYPGSVYHTTKCLDALLFQFYNKNDGVRVTDLHQGIVWGTNTPLTGMDERLTNRFDYDGDYGTVLNRFLMQAALGVPLTVYGTGGQTRGFIHVTDTAKCIELAINNPPAEGEGVEIFNQVAETRRVRDIAEMISSNTGVPARFLANPRQEAAENELDVSNRKFRALGFEPTLLNDKLFEEVQDVTNKYKDRCIPTKILPASFWNKKRALAAEADGEARSDIKLPEAVAARGNAPSFDSSDDSE